MRAAELMVHSAAALFETGAPCGEEANLAKMLAADASWAAAEACLQTHGVSALPRISTSSASSARRGSIKWRRFLRI